MPKTLADFEGVWAFSRRIRDYHGTQSGAATGQAEFVRRVDALFYSETAALTFDRGGTFQAERRYIWTQTALGIAVAFEDGRPFHSFSMDAAAEAAHWCDPDTYKVRYAFNDWPVWRAEWQVSGPSKNYVMTTTYRRRP